MKQTKLSFIFLLSLLFCTNIFAQNLSWNPTAKIPGNIHQYFLGKSGSNSYALFSNGALKQETKQNKFFTHEIGFTFGNKDITLAKYDEGFNLLSGKDISFKKKSAMFINGIINDKGIVLFYFGTEKASPLYADKFSLEGVYLETKTIRPNGDGFDVLTSQDGKNICVIGNGELSMLDADLNETVKKDLPAKYVNTSGISASGEVYGLGEDIKSGRMTPFYFNPQGGNVASGNMVIKSTSGTGKSRIQYYVSLNNNKLFVISLTGESYKRMEKSMTKGYVSNYINFSATGYEVHSYDAASMKELASGNGKFSRELLAKFYDTPQKDDELVGIDELQLENAFVNSKGELIIVSEQSYEKAIETSEMNNGRPNTSTEYMYCNGHIFLMKLDAKMNKTNEQVVERRIQAFSYLQYLTGLVSLWNNDKLYLMFNNNRQPNVGFVQAEVNTDLSIGSIKATKTYDVAKLEMCTTGCYLIGNNKYVLFGKYKKEVGSATISF